MKVMDPVEVTVEKKKYIREGVHKGMQGWICDSRKINGHWLVNIPQNGEKDDIATLPVREEDLALLPNGMDVRVNEKIKAQHEEPAPKETGMKSGPFTENDGDVLNHMV